MIRLWISSFITAWNLLVDIPIGEERHYDDDYARENRIIASFPLVGFALAFIFYILISFMAIFFGSSAKIIISAVVIALLIELLSSGKNLISLGNMIESIAFRQGRSETVKAIQNTRLSDTNFGMLTTLSLFIIRLFCLGVLIGGENATWIFVVMTGSFAAQSMFTTAIDIETRDKFIGADEKGVMFAWVIAAILSVISGNKISAVVISFIILFLLLLFLKNYVQNRLGGVTAQMIGTVGTASELSLLLLGLIILARN